MVFGNKVFFSKVHFCEGIRTENKSFFNKKLQIAIKKTNNTLSNHEKILGVIVDTHQWTIDNGFLTPTLKIKRNKVEERYTSYCNLSFENSIIQWID